MATRSPMDSSSGRASVSSQRKRPPPSKSMITPITGGERREGQVVDREGGDRARHVGQPLELHLVDGVAVEAGPGRGHVAEAAGQCSGSPRRRTSTPRSGARSARPAARGRAAAAARGAAGPPGQERGVGQVVAPRRHLLGDGRHARLGAGPLRLGQRGGRPEHEGVRAVGQRQHGDHLAGLCALEHVAQRHAGVGRAEIPDRGQQVGRQHAVAYAEPAGSRLDGAGVQPRHDGVVDVALG